MESISPEDARRSLDSVDASRRDVAQRLVTPGWYYPVLGLLIAQMIVVYALLDGAWPVASALLVAVGSGWLVRAHSGRTGITVSRPVGMRSGLSLAAFAAGMCAPVLYVVFVDGVRPAVVLGLAGVALVSTVVLGPVHDAAHRADLRRRSAGSPA